MTFEDDAAACLMAAIREDTGRPTRRDEFDSISPDDIGYEDASAWLHTLELAVDCLRRRYEVTDAERGKAQVLLGKVLDFSHAYLLSLIIA